MTEWETKPLGSVITLQRGFDLPQRLRKSGTVPIVTSSGLAGKHSEAKVKSPGVVTGRYGTIGNVFFLTEDFWPLNTTLYVRDFHGNDPLFTSYLLRTIDFQTHSGKSGVPGVNRNDLHQVLVSLPSAKAEQEVIAEALSDATALIESHEQLLAKKRQIKRGAMQELLTGEKRLPGFGGKWEVVNAGDIGRFRGGSGFPTKFQGASSGEYPFFKVSDMNNESNETFMETANNYISEALRKHLGAIAFPGKSIVFAKVGAAVFLERKKILARASCLDNNMAAFVLDASRADYRFIHYLLLNTKLSSLVSTTALPSLSGSVLAAIEFVLPIPAEQTAIVSVLSDMDAEIASQKARLAKARQLKQGMMQELLTGRIRLVDTPTAQELELVQSG